jgi:hypothetical protein
MTLFPSWADFLTGHDEADEANANVGEIGERFGFDAAGEIADNLKGEASTLFLGMAADGSPLLLHHITDLGSTRREPEPSLVALMGLQGTSTVVRVELSDCFAGIPIDESELASDYALPSFTKLLTTATTEAFRKSKPQSKHAFLRCLSLVPVPPFLVPCVAANAHGDFGELGLAFTTAVKESTLKCEKGKAMTDNTHCRLLVHFAWWAAQGGDVAKEYRINITPLVDPKPSIRLWLDRTTRECLGTTTPPSSGHATGTTAPSSTGLSSEDREAALLEVMGKVNTTMDAILLKDPDKATDSKQFARLPSHLKLMMYRLGHIPGTPEPTALCDEGQVFMTQHTLASSTSLLRTALRKHFGLIVQVQQGSVAALRTGQLLWDDPSMPGNHSVFQYYSPASGDNPDSTKSLAWHLKSTEGRGVEGDDIKAALKLEPRVANSVFGCSRQIQNFGATHGHIYRDGCPIHESLQAFGEWMLSTEAMNKLENLEKKHDRFFERLLATLDIRVQEYIASCADAATVDEIESSFLDFTSIQQHLRLQIVSELVGPVFLGREQVPVTSSKRAGGDLAAPAPKRKVVKNTNPVPSLVLASFPEWDKVRRFTDLIPKVNGTSICGLFHCRLICNSGCEKSHAPLSAATIAATEAWIAESKAKTSAG